MMTTKHPQVSQITQTVNTEGAFGVNKVYQSDVASTYLPVLCSLPSLRTDCGRYEL